MNSEDQKDGLEERNTSDTSKNGKLGDGKEHSEHTIKEFVEESCGGQDVEMFVEDHIITTDTTTGPKPGNINMSSIKD